MIAACPSCGARYRIETAKLRPEGARLRCSRCENVFRVRAPESAKPGPEASSAKPLQTPGPATDPAGRLPEPPREVQQAAPPELQQAAPRELQQAPPRETRQAEPPASRSAISERLVLVAHPEVEVGRSIGDALASWGLETLVVHDGVEAILNIQRALPRVVILDAALPKMFGFQVCELVKRNESLRVIDVILVGAIHDQDRYRRPPGDLYGADAYVEGQELPQALVPLLEGFGLPVRIPKQEVPAIPEPRPVARPVSTRVVEDPPAAIPAIPEPSFAEPVRAAAPEASALDPALAAEVEQAERLARIIVSDVVLYNPEKFEAGVRAGNVVQVLGAEIEEGRGLFAQRVDPRVGDPGDFLEKELLRVARSRGMK